jgi:tetratricopeptide (TPR) repeat protein
LDDEAAAQVAYTTALTLEPDWAASAFWTRSALRQATLASFEPPPPEPGRPLIEARRMAGAARAAIAAGDLDAGRRMLQEVYALNNQESELYLGLAELAVAEGDVALAEDYIRAGFVVQATTNQHKAAMMLLLAEIAAEQGEDDLAIERYQAAFAAITTESLYGWGSRGWVPYNLFVFQRQSFAEDLLPQLERADIPLSVAQRLLVLANLYEERGETEQAAAVRAALAPYLP